MSVAEPHYLLFSESHETLQPGRWRFVLRSADGSERIVADDIDPDARGERLALLTVVRGLEALGQPSHVTLLTPSPYVRQGIRYGLSEWRRNGWRWEFFGQMVPVKNRDLWRRVDRALAFHQIECRHWRIDPPHRPGASSGSIGARPEGPLTAPTGTRERPRCRPKGPPTSYRGGIAEQVRRWKRRVAVAWTALVSCPWFG